MLKLGAVDLNDRVRLAEQNFGRGFDNARLARAGRAEEQHRADRPRRIVHPGEIDLKQSAHAADGAFLADDQGRKACLRTLLPAGSFDRDRARSLFDRVSFFWPFRFSSLFSYRNAELLVGVTLISDAFLNSRFAVCYDGKFVVNNDDFK